MTTVSDAELRQRLALAVSVLSHRPDLDPVLLERILDGWDLDMLIEMDKE